MIEIITTMCLIQYNTLFCIYDYPCHGGLLSLRNISRVCPEKTCFPFIQFFLGQCNIRCHAKQSTFCRCLQVAFGKICLQVASNISSKRNGIQQPELLVVMVLPQCDYSVSVAVITPNIFASSICKPLDVLDLQVFT